MPFHEHREVKVPVAQSATDEISHILASCAREGQVFLGGSIAGAVDYARNHPVNAVVDTALGLGIGLATKNYTEVAHLLTLGAAGMVLSAELSRVAKADLPTIFDQTWHDELGRHVSANAHKVAEALGPMAFNTLTISAFAGAGMAYSKYAGRFSIADTDAVRIGDANFASSYYGKRFDRMPGIGYTRLNEDGVRVPVATSIKELEHGRNRLPFEPDRNVYLERIQQPVTDSEGLSSYTGKFERNSIGQFRRIAETHQSMMDEKFQPNPILTEIPE